MHRGKRSTQHVLKLSKATSVELQTAKCFNSHSRFTRGGAATQPFTRKIINEGTMLSNGYCAGISLQASRLCMQRLQRLALLAHENLEGVELLRVEALEFQKCVARYR